MEKKLIFVDWHLFNRNKNTFLNNLTVLNEIAAEYDTLGLGKITPERTQEIISGNFRSIENDLSVAVEKEVKNQFTREFIETGVFAGFEIFKSKIEHLVSRFNRNQNGALGIIPTPFEYYTIKKNRFEITDATWEKVKENCSNYIENEQELKIFEAIEKLAESANKVLDCVGENTRLNFDPAEFLILTENGFEPDPETDYKFLTQ